MSQEHVPEDIPKEEFPEVQIQEIKDVELPKYNGYVLPVPQRIPTDLGHFDEGIYVIRNYNPFFNKLVKLEQDYYKCLYDYRITMNKMLAWIEKNTIK